MRVPALFLALPLLAACSTMRPTVAPTAIAPTALSEATDIAGRWEGKWTGAGLFYSDRRETVFINFNQQGDLGAGRLVLEGTGAFESVPWEVRRSGQWGIPVIAKISDRTVMLRHQLDGRLFSVNLELSENGQRMAGVVKGSWPPVGLVLMREPSKTQPPAPQQHAVIAPPAPQPVATEPAPPMIAVPEDRSKTNENVATARPRQEEFTSVAALIAIHFDFDRADLRPDAVDVLHGHATWLKDNADVAVLIEGHCDEKGTAEYNVALGERRAKSVRDYLTASGIASDRITTVSYGKERKACADGTRDCHELNRRAEFRVKIH